MTQLGGDVEDFVRALGVTLETFDDCREDCATWDAQTRHATLCRHLCPGRSQRVVERLLARINFGDEPPS